MRSAEVEEHTLAKSSVRGVDKKQSEVSVAADGPLTYSQRPFAGILDRPVKELPPLHCSLTADLPEITLIASILTPNG